MNYLQTKSSIKYTVLTLIFTIITLIYMNNMTICITSCSIGLWIFDFAVYSDEIKRK